MGGTGALPQLSGETLARLLTELKLNTFIAVDLETTGLDPEHDEIIELGAVRFHMGQPRERFGRLARPMLGLPPEITKLTGISPAELERSPPLEQVLPEFLGFLSTDGSGAAGLLIAHNAEFDRLFLVKAASRCGLELPERDWLDTLLLARAFLPWFTSHGLGRLAQELDLPVGRSHRAAEDAERAGLLLLKLLARGLTLEEAVLQELAALSPPSLRRIFLGLMGARRQLKLFQAPRARARPEWRPRPKTEPDEGFQLNPERIGRVFGRAGPLAQALPEYTERSEQRALARAVAQVLNESRFLIAEAGTGTGKSFAYLIPAIYWAHGRGRTGRVIVSTNTKNLQDQLYQKDLPLLHEALDLDFHAVLLKGRGNYICLHKWYTLLRERALQPSLGLELGGNKEAPGFYLSIPVWLAETETGDIEENGGFWKGEQARRVWETLADDPDYCLGSQCPFYEGCFSVQARRAAREADLVIVNHALLLADLEQEHVILGPYDYLIIDEAHNLPRVATEHFSQELSFWGINGLLDELYRERPPRPRGLLARLGELRLDRQLEGALEELILLVRELRREASFVFNALTAALRERHRDNISDYTLRQRYETELFTQLGLNDDLEHLQGGLALLGKGLQHLLTGLDMGTNDNAKDNTAKDVGEISTGGEATQALLARLRADLARAGRLEETIAFLREASDERFVFWYDLPSASERLAALHATPLDVAEQLYERLFKDLKAAVLTSATLSVAGNFDFFLHRTGLERLPEGRLTAQAFGDPFDYKKNALLAVPEFLPELDDEGFPGQLAELLWELSTRLQRRMMVLFTSYKLLQRVQQELRTRGGSELALWAQGSEASRAQLLYEFRHSVSRQAILLGTSSFWEGVDLPGEELEILVLTRLPFPVPDEPVVAARAEQIRAAGGDPFYEYFLPQAVLKLRQGFGRLIRTHEDRGVVIITDTRIVRRNYGRHFRASLPSALTAYYTPSRLLVELEEFFAQKEE